MQQTGQAFYEGRRRALDFLRTFVTLSIVLIGVGFTPDFELAMRAAAFGAALSLTVATIVISPAVYPGGFAHPGCEPRYWIDDIKSEKPLVVMLGEQAQSLDQSQSMSEQTLLTMARRMKRALWAAASAPIVAVIAGAAIAFFG
ncbi:MAG: hypothetical protein AAF449_01710 [Myxococcota bacterium]